MSIDILPESNSSVDFLDDEIQWKRNDELRCYRLWCYGYLRSLFQKVKEDGYVFYYDPPNELETFRLAKRFFFEDEKIDIGIFKKDKIFYRRPLIDMSNDNFDKLLVRNQIFTITNVEFSDDSDHKDADFGCGQCLARYPGGFSFDGIVYNYDQDPVKYHGYF